MKKETKDDFSEQVIKYILAMNDEELGGVTIERITYMLNISRSYLYERFKIEKKFTPREFLVMIKMLRSASMLLENELLTVRDVARKMGFSNLDYFKKVFKAHFGTTPSRYRRYARNR